VAEAEYAYLQSQLPLRLLGESTTDKSARTYSGRVFFYEAGRKKVRNGHFSSALLTTMQNPVDRRQRDLINIDKSGFQWRVVSVAGCGFFADGYTVRCGISIKTRRCRPR
jgi:hypothetical protein